MAGGPGKDGANGQKGEQGQQLCSIAPSPNADVRGSVLVITASPGPALRVQRAGDEGSTAPI